MVSVERCGHPPGPGRAGRLLVGLGGALACAAALAGCASAGATASRPAASSTASARAPFFHAKPLLRCTSAQRAVASGSVHELYVISGQTVHVTVGERVDINQIFALMRPDGTGVGALWLAAGQQVICQSGDVQGRFTGGKPGQRLPLIVTRAGRAQIKIIAQYVEGGSPGFGIINIGATSNGGAD